MKFRYRDEEESGSEESVAIKGSHSRSNTNTKLVSSDDKNNRINESSSGSSLADIKEIESSQEDNLEMKQRQHTLKVVVREDDELSDAQNK